MKNILKILFLLLIASTVVSAQNSTSDSSKPPEVGICIVGEVHVPACITVRKKIGLIEALAFAGGPTEKARDEIRIYRKVLNSANLVELSFKLKELTSGKIDPELQDGDTVIVPRGAIVIPDEKTSPEMKKKMEKLLLPRRENLHVIPPFKFAPDEV